MSAIFSLSVSMAAWDLSVTVEELGPEATPFKVSVTSDLHIGGVVLRIVEKTREFPTNVHFNFHLGRIFKIQYIFRLHMSIYFVIPQGC